VKARGIGAVQRLIPYASVKGDGSLELGDHLRDWDLNRRGDTSVTIKALRWKASYDLDFATVTYLGGYQRTRQLRDND